MRDIADAAGVSTGNVYHHFPDKEAIFRTLLDEYHEITRSTRFPLARAFGVGKFPDNLEHIGRAARESVEQYRSYMALHYVDETLHKVIAETSGKYAYHVVRSSEGIEETRLEPHVLG